MTPPPVVLCSGSLGAAPLEEKWRAAAAAGFSWVSVYGHEYDAAVAAGVDCRALLAELDLRVAEVDGVATTMRSSERFSAALGIAEDLRARSITIVEAGEYDPGDPDEVAAAAAAFGSYCDRAAALGLLVHIEPFAWSPLARTEDVAAIVLEADRSNGGVLLDLWHHVRGPDGGRRSDQLPVSAIFEVQLADTGPSPWPVVRDECMTDRRLPGEGHADLTGQLASLAALGPLPPIGVEVFGDALDSVDAFEAARRCWSTTMAVLTDAGIAGTD